MNYVGRFLPLGLALPCLSTPCCLLSRPFVQDAFSTMTSVPLKRTHPGQDRGGSGGGGSGGGGSGGVLCTFKKTGRTRSVQEWRECKTCDLTFPLGVCLPCTHTCHEGHELGDVRKTLFFCDCGDTGV